MRKCRNKTLCHSIGVNKIDIKLQHLRILQAIKFKLQHT